MSRFEGWGDLVVGGRNHLETPSLIWLVSVLGRLGDWNFQLDCLQVVSLCGCAKQSGLEPSMAGLGTAGFLTWKCKAPRMAVPAKKVIVASSLMAIHPHFHWFY